MRHALGTEWQGGQCARCAGASARDAIAHPAGYELALLVFAIVAAGRRILIAPHAVDVLLDDRLAARLPQPFARGEVGDLPLVLRRRDVDHVRIGELAAGLDAGVGSIAAPRT